MDRPPFEVARIDQLDEVPLTGTLVWRPIRRRFDIRAFGTNAYTAANAGDEVVEDHTESRLRHEELYVVIAGRARFTLGDEEVDAPTGTLVFLRDPEVRRHAVATEVGTTVLAIGGAPGKAFEPSPWEHSMIAAQYAHRGDYDRAIELAQTGLDENPDDSGILFNLACFEAMGGRADDAIAHLRRSIELNPEMAEFAKTDSDFDTIRDREDFPA